jgi:hypothetical protein
MSITLASLVGLAAAPTMVAVSPASAAQLYVTPYVVSVAIVGSSQHTTVSSMCIATTTTWTYWVDTWSNGTYTKGARVTSSWTFDRSCTIKLPNYTDLSQ